MKDRLGAFLVRWRVTQVLPHVSGRLLDIGCGTNELIRSYDGNGVGVDVHQWGDVDIGASRTAASILSVLIEFWRQSSVEFCI